MLIDLILINTYCQLSKIIICYMIDGPLNTGYQVSKLFYEKIP